MLQDEQDRLQDEHIGCRMSRTGYRTSRMIVCRMSRIGYRMSRIGC